VMIGRLVLDDRVGLFLATTAVFLSDAHDERSQHNGLYVCSYLYLRSLLYDTVSIPML